MLGVIVHLVAIVCLVLLPRGIALFWITGYLVSFGSCALLERKLARLEQRAFHMRSGLIELMPILWPLHLLYSLLTLWGLWWQGLLWEPRNRTPEELAAEDAKEQAQQERERSERLAQQAEADARFTDQRCTACGKPLPSYRRTCKHCAAPVA
jgi:hypothetical protein